MLEDLLGRRVRAAAAHARHLLAHGREHQVVARLLLEQPADPGVRLVGLAQLEVRLDQHEQRQRHRPQTARGARRAVVDVHRRVVVDRRRDRQGAATAAVVAAATGAVVAAAPGWLAHGDRLGDAQRGDGARLGLLGLVLQLVAVRQPRLRAQLAGEVLGLLEEARGALEALDAVVQVAARKVARARPPQPAAERLQRRGAQRALLAAVRVDDGLEEARRRGRVVRGATLAGAAAGAAAPAAAATCTAALAAAVEQAVLELDELGVLLLRLRVPLEQRGAALDGGARAAVLLQQLQRVAREGVRRRRLREPLEHVRGRLGLLVGLEEQRRLQQPLRVVAAGHLARAAAAAAAAAAHHHRLRIARLARLARLARRAVLVGGAVLARVEVERLRRQVELLLLHGQPRLEAQRAVAQRLRVAHVVAEQRDRQVEQPHQVAPLNAAAAAVVGIVGGAATARLEARHGE